MLKGDQVEGEHENSSIDVKGERHISNATVEGEHHQSNPIVEGKQNGIIPNDSNIQNDVFHDIPDSVSNVCEGSEPDDMFEDAPLDFDPAYPPLDK